MASASIGLRQKNISLDFIKKTAEYITGATGGYISEVMPTTSSTISGAKAGLQELESTFSNTSNAVLPKISHLKNQGVFKSINNWFMQKEEDLNGFDDVDSNLAFDVDTDNQSQIMETQVSELGKNANQVSKTILESSQKLVESQISATANLVTAADRQTAVISSGFNKTNETLNKILEVLTKNTAALIETNVANSSPSSNERVAGGKFNFSDYKKMVTGNIKNTELGMISGILSMASSMGGMITPKEVLQMGIGFGVDKMAPNLKKNIEALDNAVGDVIMGSLIRIGEHRNDFGPKGKLAQIFGIDSSRENISTHRSSLELKNVSFDSVARESLIGAIPGYMRHILMALGGPDLTYDFRSRSFKSKGAIKREYMSHSINSIRTFDGGNAKNALVNDNFSGMMYEMMMNDLGSKSSTSLARNTISRFGNKQEAQDYILKTVLSGIQLSDDEFEHAGNFANKLGSVTDGMGSHQMINQISRNNINRNRSMRQYIDEADAYGVDLSFINDGPGEDRKAIAKKYGKDISSSDSKVSAINPVAHLQGTNYTNMALYEIYRRLNEGINVFQVGSSRSRRSPFEKFGDDYLTRPLGHKPKQTKTMDLSSTINDTPNTTSIHGDDSDNLLQNNTFDDGSVENLSRGKRFTRWGKKRGGNLAKAMFSGNADQVREAFSLIVRDVTEVGGDQIKKGMIRVNDSFGNISGYMKHKLFGSGYSYDSGETDEQGNPVKVHIKDNKGGGVFGFVQDNVTSMFKNGKDRTMKWFKDVAGYFDYRGNKDSAEDGAVEGKRKRLLFASVGSMAGAGILGGPLGLLVGAVAGNALSATGIGDKIKGLLFGKDYLDKNGEEKHKLGLIERAVNGVVDPIKYQVGKSFSTLSKVLKKNVMGPLSDIGLAIKGRITDAVSETSKTAFGKVFGFIGKMLMLPFKGITSTAKLPINIAGSMFRGITGATGSAVGSSLGLTASLLANSEDRKLISQRRKDRNHDIDKEYEGAYEGGYKAWKAAQDERRSANWGKLKDSTKEERMTQEEIAESNKKIEESSAESAEGITTLARLGSEEGSIYTHDHGLHGRLDTLIELMGGKKALKGTSSQDRALVDSIIGATGSMMSTEGVVSMDEARLGSSIIDEAAKSNPSKSSVISKFKALVGVQSKRKDEDPNKKESILDKILKNWQIIGAGILAGLAMMNDGVRNAIGNIGGNLLEAGKNLWRWIKDGDKDGSNSNAPLNALTSPLDMKTNYTSAYLNPFADINHVKTDAAGNDITNINATRAKDAPWYHLGVQGITRGTSSVGYRMDANKQLHYAEVADDLGWQARSDKHLGLAADAEKKAASRASKPFGWGSSGIARGMGTLGVGLAGGQVVGKAVGGITSKVLQNYGVDEEWADRGGRVAETIGTIKGTSYVTKKAADIAINGTDNKLIKWAMDHSIKVLESLGEKVGASKSFAAAAKPISEFISKAKGSITEKALVPLTETIIKLAAKCGVQVSAGVVTAGIANAIIAAGGGIIQGCNTENLFGVSPGQADGLMTTVATGLGALFNLPFVCLVEIIDIVLAPVNDGKGVRQSFAEIIYNTLKGDGGATLSEKQSSLQGDVDDYNKKYGTSLDKATYNDMVNQGIMDKIWTGGTKMKDGHAVFKDNGERDTNGGIKGGLDYVGAKISNEYNYAKNKIGNEVTYVSNKADEFWNGKNLVDENGKEVVDEDGKPVKNGGLKDWGMKTIGKFTSTIGTIFTGVGSIAKDWWAGEYERDENGDPLVDEDGNPVRKGGFKDWAIGGIESTISTITTPIADMIKAASDSIDGMVTGASDWVNNESEWAKSQFKSAGEYVSDKISTFFTTITGPVNDFVDGAKDWVTTKADWGVDGVKEWISKKSDEAWDWISSPFKSLFSKGKQEQKDQASISNRGGKGGGLDEVVRPIKMTTGGIGGPAEAGDPLNKPVKVTSPFGERIHPVTGERKFHKGIDLVPADGGDAQVGAVYPGKVTAVGFEPGGAGNYVFYQTSNGMTIKNMHMKDGSIPGNIVEGATINAGDKLGDMGSTGGSTAPHLHYQIEQNGEPIDPSPFVDGSKALSSFKGGSAPNGSNKSSAPAGPLAALLGNLQNAGSAYLNKISGGLFGNMGTSNNSQSSSKSGSGTATFSGLTDGPVQKQVFDYLKNKGYSTAAAAGIMGNISQESGFRPDAIEDNGEGHGLMQWSYDRKTDLFNFAESNGKPWSDTELQLEYFNKEMENGSIDSYLADSSGTVTAAGTTPIHGGLAEFKQQTDPATAARLFEGAYERAETPRMENRIAAAEAFNKTYAAQGGEGGGLDEVFSKIRTGIGSKIKDAVGSNLSSMGSDIINSITPSGNKLSKISDFIPKMPFGGNNENVELPTVAPQTQSSDNTGVNGNSTSTLESLLMQVVSELQAIRGNTGQSSNLLGELNQKEFVDNGVRESIKQLGKSSSAARKPQIPFNSGNISTVNAMIRP